jgi:pimeloyl-ACP methyl ester carboxylesterase
MTADYPVFSRLMPLLPNAIVVAFLDPAPDESLTEYAARMAEQFSPQCFIVGVSFGGIVALELSRVLKPRGCVLISSVRGPHQFPPWLRVCRLLGGRNCGRLLRTFGDTAALVPNRIRTTSTARATKLSGVRGAWHRWATSAVLDWKPDAQETTLSSPTLQIHGDADTTFPIKYVDPDVVVSNGRHALPISHPHDTANAIVAFTNGAQPS